MHVLLRGAYTIRLQAYLEVKVLACLILQQLTLKLVPGHDISYQAAVTISALHGMKMVPHVQ